MSLGSITNKSQFLCWFGKKGKYLLSKEPKKNGILPSKAEKIYIKGFQHEVYWNPMSAHLSNILIKYKLILTLSIKNLRSFIKVFSYENDGPCLGLVKAGTRVQQQMQLIRALSRMFVL
jgi:hypothetical protein